MTDDRAALDDLLCRWYAWQQDYTLVRGIKSSSIFRDYRSGRHQESDDDAADDAVERMTMRVVDAVIAKMPDEFRVALHQETRNVVAGAEVFRSPRLPADDAQRRAVVDAARMLLTVRLRANGLLAD